jgi:hypothetical protein
MDSKVILEPSIAQKLQLAINQNNGTLQDVEWLSTGENFKKISLLVRGEVEIAPRLSVEKFVDLNPIVSVVRSTSLPYPFWVKEVMHPELENFGPTEYDISDVEEWFHDGQKGGKTIEGNKIYNFLKEIGDLKNHLGYRDLLEIKKKGNLFRKRFGRKVVFGWRGVVLNQDDHLCVPALHYCGHMSLMWVWCNCDWYDDSPALRFPVAT